MAETETTPHDASPATPMIEMIKVNKWFGAFHVLKDIDLTVGPRRAHRGVRPLRVRASPPWCG